MQRSVKLYPFGGTHYIISLVEQFFVLSEAIPLMATKMVKTYCLSFQ